MKIMNYNKLKLSGRQIRLITIEPLRPQESESTPVHCTVETATLPPEPEDLDLSVLPDNYITFDDEVTDAPEEPFGGSFRHDVAAIEGMPDHGRMFKDHAIVESPPTDSSKDDSGRGKPEYEIILPINDIVSMITPQDIRATVKDAELNDRIRLTRQLAGTSNFEGRLNTRDLNPFFRPPPPSNSQQPVNPSSYVAMSYSWGPEQPTASIFLNGTEVSVRTNLEAGLRRFRTMNYFKRGGRLWVDAVCINQADEAEKMSQIPLMGSIYKLAGNVIVWLGQEADESSEAIDTLQELGSLYRTEYIEAFDNSDPFTATAWRQMAQIQLRTSFHRLKETFGQLDYDSSAEDFRVYKFFDRPYWRRLWIIQELCMGRAGMPIVCGSRVTQWRYIRDGVFAHTAFLASMQEKMSAAVLHRTNKPMQNEPSILHVAQIAQLEIHGHRRRLPDVDQSWLPVSSSFGYGHGPLHGSAFGRALLLASQAKCFHLHDSVYGLLNIPGLPSLSITVDYTKDIASVFTEFASAFIVKGKSLELFSLLDGLGMPVRDARGNLLERKHIPSWVPYLPRTAEQRVGVIEGDWHASGNKQGFSFDGHNLEPRIRNESVLICYGFVAEMVDGVGAISKPDTEIGSRYAPEFHTGVVQPKHDNNLNSASRGFAELGVNKEPEYPPQTRALRVAAGDPRISWVLTCGADVQGIKRSFDCLYEAFPEKEPQPDSPFTRNWHFLNSSADLLIQNRPLSTYFKPFPEQHEWDPKRNLETQAARQAMEVRTKNRRLIITDSGLLGLAPILVQPGDAVMVLLGHGRPVVARNLKDVDGRETPLWHLIGEAFVNGMMEWEMMDRDIMSGPKKLRQIAFV